MSYDFTISALVFTIVMVGFNIIKDVFIIPRFNPTEKTKQRIQKRWYLSFGVGLILLYIMYG